MKVENQRKVWNNMKRKRIIAGLTCAALLTAPTAAMAESTDVNLCVNHGWIGGWEETGQTYISDDGRTMIPLRLVNTVLGYRTDWQPDGSIQITSTDGTVDVTLAVGSTAYTADGVAGTFETAPTLKNDRTYLPARDFAELYGSIYWDGDTRTVWIAQSAETMYQAIGEKVLRADENGIQELALPERFNIYNPGGTEPLLMERTINGVHYLGLLCEPANGDLSAIFQSMVPIFRDEGDSLFHVMDAYPGSYYIDEENGVGYGTAGVNAGPWKVPIGEDVLYTCGLNTPDSMGQLIYHKLDFKIDDCTLDMEDGVLIATSPDGTVHRIENLDDYPASITAGLWDE